MFPNHNTITLEVSNRRTISSQTSVGAGLAFSPCHGFYEPTCGSLKNLFDTTFAIGRLEPRTDVSPHERVDRTLLTWTGGFECGWV